MTWRIIAGTERYRKGGSGSQMDPLPNSSRSGRSKSHGLVGEGLTAEKLKKCVWVKPDLVGQFEFIEWTPDRHLRHSGAWDRRLQGSPLTYAFAAAPRSSHCICIW